MCRKAFDRSSPAPRPARAIAAFAATPQDVFDRQRREDFPPITLFPSARAGDGAALPSVTFNVRFESGALVQQAGESVEAFADRVVQSLRDRANATVGDTIFSGSIN